MTPLTVTIDHERVRLRVARSNHQCWAWQEKCTAPGDGYDDKPTCTRMISAGETYVESTIYPGHDSGYADACSRLVDGVWTRFPGRPLQARHCLPCAHRWTNLADALALLLPDPDDEEVTEDDLRVPGPDDVPLFHRPDPAPVLATQEATR